MRPSSPPLRVPEFPKRDAQIVLGRGPILRQIGLGPDLEGGAISGHRVFEQLAPFFSAAARPEFLKRDAQIVLGRGPILRQIGFGPDLEGGAISGHRLFEQFAPFFSAAARPEFLKRDAQIVLGRGPILRRFSTLIEGKRPLTNFRCFFQLQVALRRFDRYALLYKEPCEGVSRIGPVRLQGEDVGEEAVSLGGLVAVGLRAGRS